jgi:hypothetical protein
LTKPTTIKGRKKRIGLRWQGSTQFEHEHKKQFPYDLLFSAVKDADVEFISLQRDEGVDAAPAWVKAVKLDTWEDTRQAVASCDLVISSCTSVSHLSAAMGIDTWVVSPIMAYFLYSLDTQDSNGLDTTPYYASMRLFRQEVFGDWTAPFAAIKVQLDKAYKHATLRSVA